MALVNAHTISPHDIKPGDEMLFVVKALVVGADDEGRLRYRLYRCAWEGDERSIPQGNRVDETMRIDQALFPSLAAVGTPD